MNVAIWVLEFCRSLFVGKPKAPEVVGSVPAAAVPKMPALVPTTWLPEAMTDHCSELRSDDDRKLCHVESVDSSVARVAEELLVLTNWLNVSPRSSVNDWSAWPPVAPCSHTSSSRSLPPALPVELMAACEAALRARPTTAAMSFSFMRSLLDMGSLCFRPDAGTNASPGNQHDHLTGLSLASNPEREMCCGAGCGQTEPSRAPAEKSDAAMQQTAKYWRPT